MISLNRLIEGGAAMLAHAKINQSIDIVGNKFKRPLVINILRELVASYVIFAIANIPEEHKP